MICKPDIHFVFEYDLCLMLFSTYIHRAKTFIWLVKFIIILEKGNLVNIDENYDKNIKIFERFIRAVNYGSKDKNQIFS